LPRRALAERPRPAKEAKAEAREDGIAEETLKRARRGLCSVLRAGGRRPAWLGSLKAEGGEYDDAVGREDTVEERETTVSSLPTVSSYRREHGRVGSCSPARAAAAPTAGRMLRIRPLQTDMQWPCPPSAAG